MWTESFSWALGVSAAIAVVVAVAGGVLTEIGPWYDRLKKPSWKPPDWAFGPVWTVILVLAAFSAAIAWDAAETAGERTAILAVLIVNSILNIAWSGIFFKMKRPDWALYEVAMLWLSILALIIVLGGVSATAGLLMVPYLVWVSVAAFLNYRIVEMNKPFG
jgi:tryptophan-rich sensory protein